DRVASEGSVLQVFVTFEGPWAIAPDPEDASSVLLLAPKTKAHRDLYVTASNNSALAAGTYDLSVPARTGSAAETFDDDRFAALALRGAKTVARHLTAALYLFGRPQG